MTDYYFTADPNSAHEYQQIQLRTAHGVLNFQTDSGVFSKNRVDYGSRVLLDAMAQLTVPKGDILDVGCGYGPIGMALAAAHPELTCYLVDVNERALALAQHNAVSNHLANVKIAPSDCYANVSKTDFGTIVTNPPIRAGKAVVHTILAKAFDHLMSGGMLVCVIQKKQGAASAKKKMQAVFGNCEVVLKDKGYYILKSVKEAQ